MLSDREQPEATDEGTQLLAWWAARPSLVVGQTPRGEWQVFDAELARLGIHKGCNGATPHEALAKARKYDFPSNEGYHRMVADQKESKGA